MSSLRLVCLTIPLLVLVGCGLGRPGSPLLPPATPPGVATIHRPGGGLAPGGLALPAGTIRDGLIQESTLAVWNLSIDTETLAGHASLQAGRSAQETDDLYELPLDNLVNPGSFQIVSISGDDDSINVEYRFTHPFPAPVDPSAPATAGNRADLGIAGRVLFLADVEDAAGNSFFEGEDAVVANTALVQRADVYLRPGVLVNLSGFTANTFPAMALIDERNEGSREGISNAGNVRGNHNASTGWQLEDFGAGNTGFTGFGILHQGQASTRTIELSTAALGVGERLDLSVAILAKYVDPRGGTTLAAKKTNRLPSGDGDVTKFLYREPHGALDLEAIRFQGQLGVPAAGEASDMELRFTVVDWDARTTETTETNLADDPLASRVAIGAGGPPSLAVCIPGVTGTPSDIVILPGSALEDDDTLIGGDSGTDTGRPGDGLYYQANVSNTVTSQVRGSYRGMVRAIDAEDDEFDTRRIYLDASLIPQSTNLPRIRAYQVFDVTIGNNAPLLELAPDPDTVESGTAPRLQVVTAIDADGDPLGVEVDWDDDGTYESSYSVNPGATPSWQAEAVWVNPGLAPGSREVRVRFSDGLAPPIDLAQQSFTLGPNQPPQLITGSIALQNAELSSPAQFILVAPELVVFDPEGDAITYWVRNNRWPSEVAGSGFPMPAHAEPFYDGTSPVEFTVAIGDTAHGPDDVAALDPIGPGTVHGPGWATRFGAGVFDAANAVAAGQGQVYVAGTYTGTVDFGSGPRTAVGSLDLVLLAYDLQGQFRWAFTVGSVGGDTATDCGIRNDGTIGLIGTVNDDIVQAPLNLTTSTARPLEVVLTRDGEVISGRFLTASGTASVQSVTEVVYTDDDALVIAGFYSAGNVSFAGTPHADAAGASAGFLVKLDATGAAWENIFNDSQCRLHDVTENRFGDLIAVGEFTGTHDFGLGPVTDSDGGQAGIALVFLADGSVLEQRDFPSAFPRSVSSTGDSADIVLGGSYTADSNFGGGLRSYLGGGSDGFVAAYDYNLSPKSDRVFASSGAESVTAVLGATASDGLYVAGTFSDTVDCGGLQPRTGTGANAAFLASYTNLETGWQWDRVIEGTDRATILELGHLNEDLLVAGFFSETVNSDMWWFDYRLRTGNTFWEDGFVTRIRSHTGGWF